MEGVELERAFGGFATGQAHFCRLDAMVHGVAHQVGQRIANLFHHGFVQLGLGAADDQLDVFAQLLANIAHHALEAVEGAANLHHAQVQGRVTHFFDQARQGRGGLQQFGRSGALGGQAGPGPGDDEFTDQVDQRVEFVGIHADQVGLGGFAVFALFLFFQRGIDHWGLHHLLVDQHFADGLRGFARHLRLGILDA